MQDPYRNQEIGSFRKYIMYSSCVIVLMNITVNNKERTIIDT